MNNYMLDEDEYPEILGETVFQFPSFEGSDLELKVEIAVEGYITPDRVAHVSYWHFTRYADWDGTWSNDWNDKSIAPVYRALETIMEKNTEDWFGAELLDDFNKALSDCLNEQISGEY